MEYDIKPGNIYYRWKAICLVENRTRVKTKQWLCLCIHCGNQQILSEKKLYYGIHAGCEFCPSKAKIKAGNVYGLWTVIERRGQDSRGARYWLCQCQCGTVKEVIGPNLYRGQSTSCGCQKGPKKQEQGI